MASQPAESRANVGGTLADDAGPSASRFQEAQRHSLIVQAALDAGCTTLYTEELQHGLRIGELEIVNPFLQATAVHEPAAAYAAAPRRRGK